ncbi:MAG: TetR family transcriptional regulator [Eubacteriales bacterium]|jgi:transcriptional regulator, TetR family
MPKDVKDLAASRREEIVNACETLYKTKSFKDITIKDIGGATTFTRTSVYNYFETKEEIFLALLTREYLLWVSDLQTLLGESVLSRKEYAEALARSLQARPVMLKLLSVNMYEIEGNSRIERLTEFKKAYGAAIKAISQSFVKSFPERGERGAESFVYSFFPFLFGIYPYTNATEKQKAAMDAAGVKYAAFSAFDLAYNAVIKLLQ